MQLMVRDYEILGWLLHMKFMHLDQIGRKFFPGCNIHRAPYRRMLKLMEAGLVATRKVYSDPRDLYIPTKAAVGALRSADYPYAILLPKDKTFPNYFHDRGLIDLRILFAELEIGIWAPERVIRSVKSRGSAPDALLVTADEVYAVEYERTEKEPSRYKKIFNRYNNSNKYDKVLYILPTEKRIDRLKEKLGYIWKKFYFVSKESLFRERREATFYSSCEGLPVSALAKYSLDGSIMDFEPEELRKIVESESPDAWKGRKQLVPFTGGSKRHSGETDDQRGENSDGSNDPSLGPRMYPTIYPGERDGNHEDGNF